MKLITTRRDVSAWIIVLYLLLVNIICIILFGRFYGIIIGNPIGLGTVTIFVKWSRHNKRINSWLNHKI